MAWERKPFFLRGCQENITREMARLGLPADAPLSEKMRVQFERGEWSQAQVDRMDTLYSNAGLSPDKAVINARQMADTMNSQRLGRWAASVSSEKGEAMWRATSRRYFEGKDALIRPIRLDSREMLLECAEVAGLDVEEAKRILDSDLYRSEIEEEVEHVHSAGIQSIPVMIFEVEGLTNGSWLRDPRVTGDPRASVNARMHLHKDFSRTREINHGSGNKADFKEILKRLHSASNAAS